MIDNIYNISPQQINYILELVAERSFQKASAKCFVTQPTLSMQIKKVEDIIGFAIFDRSRNPIELTPSGEVLIPLLRDVQREYLRVDSALKRLKGEYKEQLIVGVIPTISHYLLNRIFEQTKEKLSHVQLKFEEHKTEDLLVLLDEGKVDLAILAGPYNEPRMRTIPLFQEEIKLYAPDVKKKQLEPNDLIDVQPWLLSKGNCLRTQMVNFCSVEEDQIDAHWNYEGGSVELLIKMVDLNKGYTLVPEHYDLGNVELKRMLDPVTKEYPAREVIGVFSRKSLKLEACEALIRLIQLEFNQKRKEQLKILSWQ